MTDKLYLGVELGSTRIKSVLIDAAGTVLCGGAHEWENRLENGLWTYTLDDVWNGLRHSYTDLREAYEKKYGKKLETLRGIGISAMMHGYLAFDAQDNLLVPFRTWRNTNTAEAAAELSEKLYFNIPQRWSGAHFYQAVLNKEAHVPHVTHLNTLAGYVHYKLTGKRVLGVGDASGMFPIEKNDYDRTRIAKYNALLAEHGVEKDLYALLPKVLLAGEDAGTLTEEGARLLDESGTLQAGAPLCPPEGDAGTGMVATNAVKVRTGNVSAGTSAFAMVVTEKPLERVYSEIDMVTTPDGFPVAMVHVNNFTNEINAWAGLFAEAIELAGGKADKGTLFEKLFRLSLSSDVDCGGFVGYNFLSGEPIAGVETGSPLLFRSPDGKPNLAGFMQMQIYSALGALAMGMEILEKENVRVEEMCGHGGFFKTDFVGANAMSAAVGAPVTVMKNAGEGGAWGIALLALYAAEKKGTLAEFLGKIFGGTKKTTVTASADEKKKFAAFMQKYKANLAVVKHITQNR